MSQLVQDFNAYIRRNSYRPVSSGEENRQKAEDLALLGRVKEKLEAAEADGGSADHDQFRRLLAAHETVKLKLEEAKVRIGSLKRTSEAVHDLRAANQNLKAELAGANERLVRLSKRYDALEGKNTDLLRQLLDSGKRIGNLENDNADLASRLEEAEDVKELKRELATLRKVMAKAQAMLAQPQKAVVDPHANAPQKAVRERPSEHKASALVQLAMHETMAQYSVSEADLLKYCRGNRYTEHIIHARMSCYKAITYLLDVPAIELQGLLGHRFDKWMTKHKEVLEDSAWRAGFNTLIQTIRSRMEAVAA